MMTLTDEIKYLVSSLFISHDGVNVTDVKDFCTLNSTVL